VQWGRAVAYFRFTVYVGYSMSGRYSAMRFTQTYHCTVSDLFIACCMCCAVELFVACVVLCNAAMNTSCLSTLVDAML
jgi:hypothetical protein